MKNTEIYDICCVGHITKDKIVTPEQTVYSPGGTAFYFSHAISRFDDIRYILNTIAGKSEQKEIQNLRDKGIEVFSSICNHSVYFENIYEDKTDKRIQRVLSKADPFSVEILNGINAHIIHLGPLLNDDFPVETIKSVSGNQLLSIDVQGFLRSLHGIEVVPVNWHEKEQVLKDVFFLKANEYELEALLGTDNIIQGMNILYEWGVKEIIVTLGHSGSIVFDGKKHYPIPAYKPCKIADATGCGDTYMAGYLYSRSKNKSIEDSGNFAAAMATLKIEHSGPFSGSKQDVMNCINTFEKNFPLNYLG